MATHFATWLERSVRVRDRLASSQLGIWLALAAFALATPSLAFGLQADDHILRLLSLTPIGQEPWRLFYMEPDAIAEARQTGALAWWTSPALRVEFLRPLASLTHALDFRLWPDAAWAMHMENCLLYAAIVWVGFRLYRALIPSAVVAGLAALLFAIDDAHANSTGWIAGRNALLAMLFSLLAFGVYLRAERARRPALQVVSAALLVLALASCESGLTAIAYMAAHAWVYGQGSWLRRLRTLTPQLFVCAGWAALYVTLGLGAHGTSWYRDISEPFATLEAGLLDLPVWLTSLLGPSVASALILVPATTTRLISLPVASALVALLWKHALRSPERRFLALGALLCLPPLFGTLPQDRVLLGASFGAFGLLASFIAEALQHGGRALRVAAYSLALLHGVLAPLGFGTALRATQGIEAASQTIVDAIQRDQHQDIVLLNTPLELLSMYAGVITREERGLPINTLHALYSGNSALTVERADANTLQVRAERGWGRIPFQRIFCAARDMPRTGDERALRGMHVSVLETNAAGMPLTVRFRFTDSLESRQRMFYVWQQAGLVRWRPPAIGERLSLPAVEPFALLRAPSSKS